MKSIFTVLLVTSFCPLFAQSFVFQDELSTVTFSIRNFGTTVEGEFHRLSGEFYLDEQDVSRSHFDASVEAGSIDTGIGLRDKHLRQKNYFDAEHFPKLRIASTKIVKASHGGWRAQAQVTIKGVTKDLLIEFTIQENGSSRVFAAEFTLNRIDFNVGDSSFTLADLVTVHLRVVGTAKAGNP